MLRNLLRNILFMLMSILLVSCASQKSITPLNPADANPTLNSAQPAGKADDLGTEKQIAVTRVEPVEAEKEMKPEKKAGSVLEQTSVSKVENSPENDSVTLNVQFDTGKSDIKPIYHDDIKKIADFMNKYPSTTVTIEGHTDIVGMEAANVKLSWLRANNIKIYLAEKFGIDSSRIKVIGYDYQKPIASNNTREGRQKNRRGEIRIGNNVSSNKLYSYIEDSDLPKGGFSVVNQETIDAKIRSFKEKKGVASYFARIVTEPTLELYKMWGGIFSHCAIRIETDTQPFYQMELQTLSDLKKAGINDFHKSEAAVNLRAMAQNQFDIVEFTDKNEREKLDNAEPHYATMPICIDKNAARKTTKWYQDCLSRYSANYNPDNARRAGKPTKVYEYDPVLHNCCNFAEEALQACGLAHCFDLGKSTGLNRKTGPLED